MEEMRRWARPKRVRVRHILKGVWAYIGGCMLCDVR